MGKMGKMGREERMGKGEGEKRIGGREQGTRGREMGKIERAKGRK
jgi:hypothetical protein